MKVNLASNILKILLIMFSIGAIFFGIYILPILAAEMLYVYPELEYAKMQILVICELLLTLLLFGIAIIMYLLLIFDRGRTFSVKFIRGLEVLGVLCILASMGTIYLYYFMSTFGGPGPLLSLVMIGVIFVIWIVAAVIMLVRSIVKKAIIYKDDYDLTI